MEPSVSSETGSKQSAGWTCELGLTSAAVFFEAVATAVEKASFPRRQLFIRLVWKQGSGGCVLMNYSGQ